MATRKLIEDFERLLGGFRRDIGIAESLGTPNREDDLFIRVAIVGFSYNAETEDWGRNHLEFIRDRLDAELSEEPEAIRLFNCLCLGYLLGLYQCDAVDDTDFSLGEAQLPGIAALHSPEIQRAYGTGSHL